MTTHQQQVDAYADGPGRFEKCVQGLAAEVVDFVPGPGKWSVRQIVAHVAETEMVYYGRMRMAAVEPGTAVWGFDQDVWANSYAAQWIDVDQCLSVIAGVRAMAEPWLRKLPDAAWKQTVVHSELGEITLEKILAYISQHIDAHIAQIQRNVEARAKR